LAAPKVLLRFFLVESLAQFFKFLRKAVFAVTIVKGERFAESLFFIVDYHGVAVLDDLGTTFADTHRHLLSKNLFQFGT